MSKENELLKEALSAMEWAGVCVGEGGLCEDIRAYLNLSESPTGCAAAPELYKALEKCAEVLQNFVGFSHPYIKEANAALAKARGEI